MRALSFVIAGLALIAVAAGCVTFDASSGRHRELNDASKAVAKGKKFKDVYDAWKDAIENISPDDERAVGDATAIHLLETTPGGALLGDTDVLDYVNDVANQVALAWHPEKRKNGRPRSLSRRFFVTILKDDDTLNAFSTPGGNVFVTTALLRSLDSESELAWVLGHEIAHVDHEDGLDALKASKGMPAAANEYFRGAGQGSLAGMFIDQPIFNEVAEKVVDLLVENAGFYGRAQEKSADATGLDYASDAGYDPKAAERVLRKLSEGHRAGVATDSAHGTPDERLAALAPLIKKKSDGKTGFDRYQEMAILRLGPAPEVATQP